MIQHGEMTIAVSRNAASSNTSMPQNLRLDTGSWSPDAANMTEKVCVLCLE